MEKFAIGLLIGGLCGAVLTANNCKMRSLVKKGQEEVSKRVNDFMDEKLDEAESAITSTQDTPTDKKAKKHAKQ